jgi:uncharacterized alpha/beta hydrolase family protein
MIFEIVIVLIVALDLIWIFRDEISKRQAKKEMKKWL